MLYFPKKREEERVLRCFQILDILENPEYEEVFRKFSPRSFKEKQIICDENTTENEVFVVLSGSLRAYVSYEGREFTLFPLGVGDVFVTHSKMTVEAKTAAEILVTSMADFERVMEAVRPLSLSIIASLCRGLGNGVRVIERLVFRDVKYRLICFLLDAAEERGHKVEEGIAIPMEYSTEEIASLIGSTRQSTSLAFNELVRDGHLVRVSRKLLVIRDVNRLQLFI